MTTTVDVPELYAALVDAAPTELLSPLVEQSGGALLDVVREAVGYRPGRDAHVRLAATVERAGVIGREGWVVCAGGATTGTLTLEGAAGRLSAWRVRDDPVLVGLRRALDFAAVGELLADLGVPADGLVLQLLAYRPQRRAVVVATTPTHQLFLKCVPPDKAASLHRRHAACRAAGLPVPNALGYDPSLGLLVLTPLHGEPLRRALLDHGRAGLPQPSDVVALLDDFAAVELDEPARSPLRQARGHGALLRAVLPAEASRVGEILHGVRSATEGDRAQAVVHGDLHDDQLLLLEGRVSGVVDVDGAGVGHPADDSANLLAHLIVLRGLTATGAVHSWLPSLHEALAPRHDPVALQARTAAVLMGLATWPHSQQLSDWQHRTSAILTLAEAALSGRW
jgi:hypothetical protein